jgi:hypothetical protein
MRANPGAASHTHTPGHGRVRANMHVVADLYQVVEFDAVLDHSVIQRATVNAGIGTNLNIIADAHPAQLLDFLPTTGMRRKAKAIRAYDNAGVKNAALS